MIWYSGLSISESAPFVTCLNMFGAIPWLTIVYKSTLKSSNDGKYILVSYSQPKIHEIKPKFWNAIQAASKHLIWNHRDNFQPSYVCLIEAASAYSPDLTAPFLHSLLFASFLVNIQWVLEHRVDTKLGVTSKLWWPDTWPSPELRLGNGSL